MHRSSAHARDLITVALINAWSFRLFKHRALLPGRWALTPLFDKLGRPVEYLETSSKKCMKTAAKASKLAERNNRGFTRKRLIDAIDDAGLERTRTGSKRRREKAGGR